MENIKKVKVWKDGDKQNDREYCDTSFPDALDKFCQDLGFVDHADYCQENNLEESDLNIIEVIE